MGDYAVINRRVPRLDTPPKARGRAIYLDDMTMPGMLHGALVQSDIAHGRILNIDISKAKKLLGVKSVLTAKEAGETPYGVSPARYDETLFCSDRVRYVGDEIAAVAAVDLDTAMEAASLIEVEYEELPAVFTVEEALAKGAPAIHDNRKKALIKGMVHRNLIRQLNQFRQKKKELWSIQPQKKPKATGRRITLSRPIRRSNR